MGPAIFKGLAKVHKNLLKGSARSLKRSCVVLGALLQRHALCSEPSRRRARALRVNLPPLQTGFTLQTGVYSLTSHPRIFAYIGI